MCVYIPQKALWMPNVAFPLLSLSPHSSHHSAHQDWVMMPWDRVSLEFCCPSLSGLPCALRTISSFIGKRSWITVIIPEEREFPLRFPPRRNQIHPILHFAEAFLPNCWESPVLGRWFQIFYETDHIVSCAGHLNCSTYSKSCRFCVFMSSDPVFGTQPTKTQGEVLREHFTKSEICEVSGFHREWFCLEMPRMGDFTRFYPGGGVSEQEEEPWNGAGTPEQGWGPVC